MQDKNKAKNRIKELAKQSPIKQKQLDDIRETVKHLRSKIQCLRERDNCEDCE
jgi:hypothetical protein